MNIGDSEITLIHRLCSVCDSLFDLGDGRSLIGFMHPNRVDLQQSPVRRGRGPIYDCFWRSIRIRDLPEGCEVHLPGQ
ncbi:hypothetical protein [Rhizobium sp. No.120]